MSALLAPDLPQIERALDTLLERNPEARVLGMRSPTRRNWPDLIERRGQRFRLAWCTSELEVRERLDEANGSLGLVVLTPLDPASLGCDVAARLPLHVEVLKPFLKPLNKYFGEIDVSE